MKGSQIGSTVERHGGNKFLVVLPRAPTDTISVIVSRLNSQTDDGEDRSNLITVADRRMYAARRSGSRATAGLGARLSLQML